MISRHTCRIPKEDVFSRLLYCDSRFSQTCRQCSEACHLRSQTCTRCSQTCCWCSQTCCRHSHACRQRSHVLPGAFNVVSSAPRRSQTYQNHSHCTPVPISRDLSYSRGRSEFSLTVRYSPEIDASKFTLHILTDNPGGSQRLKYILLMEVCVSLPDWITFCWCTLEHTVNILQSNREVYFEEYVKQARSV